ncbi:MAG TPA: DUF2884 family protein [Stenotrophomonas sp.]|jgi:hypothetical protein
MMRLPLRWIVFLGCLAPACGAWAGQSPPKVSSQQCGYHTPFDVQVGDDGVWLRRTDEAPRVVHVRDGAISIDDRAQPVSAADADRLRRMESITRELVPAVAGIARDAVDIAFDALAGVVEIMTGNARKAKQVEAYRRQAMAQIDASLGHGRWDQVTFEREFEAGVERAAEDMAASLTRGVLFAVFTGGTDGIEQRSEKLEKEMDARMEARGRSLEARADALCSQVKDLDRLQEQLELRYQGKPLRLIEPRPPQDGHRREEQKDAPADREDTVARAAN